MNDIGPRYDSKPTQPKDMGDMTSDEENELFDATLERDDVAGMVWEAVIDEVNKEQAKEIITALFRQEGTPVSDFMEAGRLMHKACWPRVKLIVESEEHNTDMSKD